MQNVVIYNWCSLEAENTHHLEACRKYAKANDMTVVCEYIDKTKSSNADDRPMFQKMIEDSSTKQFQCVLVYQNDRFAHNRYDSAHYKNLLKKNGVRVLSARENISDDASGILVESVLEGMAEYYSKDLSEKIKRGKALEKERRLATTK